MLPFHQIHFHFACKVFHFTTCRAGTLLGPCFKTGQRKSFCANERGRLAPLCSSWSMTGSVRFRPLPTKRLGTRKMARPLPKSLLFPLFSEHPSPRASLPAIRHPALTCRQYLQATFSRVHGPFAPNDGASAPCLLTGLIAPPSLHNSLPPVPRVQFQGLFHSLLKVLFIFPSQTEHR